MILTLDIGNTNITVSYTHLDVYKRQGRAVGDDKHRLCIHLLAEVVDGKGLAKAGLGVPEVFPAGVALVIDFGVVDSPCLDVYKRQSTACICKLKPTSPAGRPTSTPRTPTWAG